jgi:predicted kinase
MRKILIMGLPGTGKTTLTTALALLLNAVVFNADAVRQTFRLTLDSNTLIASNTLAA